MESDGKSIDEVYADRNLLACAFASLVGPWGGWTPAEENPEEWAIVYVRLPGAGQASWHVPRDLAARMVHRDDDYEYDGHDRVEKNRRLRDWAIARKDR